jgi:hypothetical protein
MWDAVASRKHTLQKVYPFGSGSDEVMLYGSVALELKNGGSADIEWAGRAELEKSADGKYRLKFYQVYLVSLEIDSKGFILTCDRILVLRRLIRNRSKANYCENSSEYVSLDHEIDIAKQFEKSYRFIAQEFMIDRQCILCILTDIPKLSNFAY